MGVIVMTILIGLSTFLIGFFLGVSYCAQNYFKVGYSRGYLDAQYGIPNQVDGSRKHEESDQ